MSTDTTTTQSALFRGLTQLKGRERIQKTLDPGPDGLIDWSNMSQNSLMTFFWNNTRIDDEIQLSESGDFLVLVTVPHVSEIIGGSLYCC